MDLTVDIFADNNRCEVVYSTGTNLPAVQYYLDGLHVNAVRDTIDGLQAVLVEMEAIAHDLGV